MSQLEPPRLEALVDVGPGRRLSIAEYGPADGHAVLWFHGTPGGRRQIPPDARRLVWERGVRLVVVERPGYGRSPSHEYGSFTEWAHEIGRLLLALGIDRCGFVGLSGGGPYVLACAHALPDHAEAAVVLGSVAPARGSDAVGGGLIGRTAALVPAMRRVRRPLERFFWATAYAARPFKDQAMNGFGRVLPEHDRAMFARPEMREMFFDDILLAIDRQIDGPLLDALLFAQPWGFALADVEVPVRVVQGDADTIVPLHHGEHLVERLPKAELEVRPGESHLGGLDLAPAILDFLASHRT